jgi:arginyl-tRNA synthetase
MPDSNETSPPRHPVEGLHRAVLAALLEPLGLGPPEAAALHPPLVLSPPPSPDLGDLSLGCFPLAKSLRQAPAAIAARIAKAYPSGVPGEVMERHVGPGDLPQAPGLSEVSAAGPYVNLRFDLGELASWLLSVILTDAPPFGENLPRTGSKVMVEYSAPNTNKPLHLGHVRNNVLGMSLSNILEAVGEEVVRVNLVNDRGIHICKSMIAYRNWGEGKDPAAEGMKPDHFVGHYYTLFDEELRKERSEWEETHPSSSERIEAGPGESSRGDEAPGDDEFLSHSALMRQARDCLIQWESGDTETRALWKRMNDWVYDGFGQTYDRMGCRFDRWYYESETYRLGKDIVEEGLAKRIFYRKEDGSVWARLESAGLQDKILLRSDGTSVYITQDLGTAVRKHQDEKMNRSLYIVGSEQILHFKNLFAILKLLGYPWADGCRHVSYGLITLPRGMGKLKSREGRSVDADSLLDELHQLALGKIEEAISEGKLDRDDVGDLDGAAERVAQAALKIYLLQVGSEKNILYDPDTTISFTGDTGPAIQYSHARIHGILRKALDRRIVSRDEIEGDDPSRMRVRGKSLDASLLRDPHERSLLLRLMEMPRALSNSAHNLTPSHVANYLLELTKTFARFYHNCPVLRAEPHALALARVALCLATARVIKRGLALLMVEAPERM